MSKNPLIDAMVDEFLRWPLPDSVCADGCATKQGPGRVGTNLLTAIEAEQMLKAVVLPKLMITTTAAVAAEPRSAEAWFIDQDLFVAYVAEKVNPERAKEGLATATDGVARHLYDVLTSGRYRR